MTHTTTDAIEFFSSDFEANTVEMIFHKKSLWLAKKDICLLFSINEKTLDEELWKIFVDGIFSKMENRERFLMWKNKKKLVEYFRLGVIISLGYRIKAMKWTQHIIQTNRILKSKMMKQENKKSEEKNTNKNIILKAITFIHTMRKEEIQKRIYA